MKLNLTINGERLSAETDPETSLLDFLRSKKIASVRCGCEKGNCGSCVVLMNGQSVMSCEVPCAVVNNAEIISLEYFSKQAAYQEIIKGFEKAGIQLCGYCNPGKIFAAYEIISRFSNPTREQVAERIQGLRGCCVERDTLINGIIYAAQNHFEKERLRKNARQ